MSKMGRYVFDLMEREEYDPDELFDYSYEDEYEDKLEDEDEDSE